MNDRDDIVPLTKPIRLLEMVFCGVLVGLLADVGTHLTTVSHVAVMYVAFGGFLVVTLVDVLSQLTGDPIPDTPMFIFCLTGCALFLASGGIATDYYQITSKTVEQTVFTASSSFQRARDELIAISVLSIVNGVIFLVDAALIFRRLRAVTSTDWTDVEKLEKDPTPDRVEERPAMSNNHTQKIDSSSGRSQYSSWNRVPTDSLQCAHKHHHDHLRLCVNAHGVETSLPGTPLLSEKSKESPKSASPSAEQEARKELFEHPPRSGSSIRGPTGRRKRRKCCRVLIWRGERTISVFLKVIEAALGCVCFLIFALKQESEHSFFSTVFTFSGIAASTALALVLVINYLTGSPPHRIPYIFAAAVGAIIYFAIAAVRFSAKDMPEMQTPILINGAVSLVDAALCIATFINRPMEAEEEKPERPPRRLFDPPIKRNKTTPSEEQTKEEKKPKFLERARRYFKHRAPETPK